MTSSFDLSTALHKVLQWKDEIGLPALEKVEQLTTDINYYMNQVIIYKSQLELMRNEMNEKISFITNNEIDKSEIILETKCNLIQISNENSFLIKELGCMEIIREKSVSISDKNMFLQKTNKHLKESNLKYTQIINRLIAEQTVNKKEIFNLNLKINEMNDQLLSMTDTMADAKYGFQTFADKIIAEKDEYMENVNKEYLKYTQFATNDNDEIYSNQLFFQRRKTLSKKTSNNNLLSLMNARSSMISDSLSPIMIFADNYFPSFLVKVQSPASAEVENENSDEKQGEDQNGFIDDVNVYEIEIEALNNKLRKYKTKLSSMKARHTQCKKDLHTMHAMYDAVAEKLKQSKMWFSCIN